MLKSIRLRYFDDMHLHLRRGEMLKKVLPYSTRFTQRAVIMPNTRPQAILTAKDVIDYRKEIVETFKRLGIEQGFIPLMTIELRDNTTPEMIHAARLAGATACKAYPLGVTTNSDEGLKDFLGHAVQSSLAYMTKYEMPLLIHGEIDLPRTVVTEREAKFLPTLKRITARHPKLKIVLEHISTQDAVGEILAHGENVAATITAHHLCFTLNDVIGYGVRPHNAYMPMPKSFTDRDALINAATSDNPKFFLGFDSAPHLRENKECDHGARGVFSAPVLPEILSTIFENANALSRLQNFTSFFGANFYNLSINQDTFKLEREQWKVPEIVEGIVPFLAGRTLSWKVK